MKIALKNKFDSIKNKIKSVPKQAKASIWFLLCSFLQKGISLLTTPIFTRLLSTVEYGNYSVFDSWLSIITVFVTLQMHAGVYVQGLVKYSEDSNKFTSSLQGLTLVLVLVWSIVYLIFKDFWNNLFSLSEIQMTAMLLMIWCTSIFNFWAAEQRVKLNYKVLVIITLIVSFFKPVVGIIFVKFANDKVTARILGLLLVEFICYTPFFFIHMFKGKKFFSKRYWKYALSFSIPLIPHYLSQTILNSADKIMIENMVGGSEAGIYSLAYSISKIMLMFSSALLSTLTPWIYQKIKENTIEKISNTAYLSITGIAIVNVLLIFIAPEIIKIFAPSDYYEAIWVIPPVALSVIYSFSYSLFAAFEFYYKKTFLIALASVIGAILNIILNYIFIPLYGYIAAAYTTLFCYMVYAAIHYCFMKAIIKKYIKGKNVYNILILLGIYIPSTIIGLCVSFLYNYPFIRYSLLSVIIITCLLFGKKIIKKFIKKEK